ncbi:hypothetical protein M752DRAFT_311431 [Aspergillus phoenicis ATCC 13157]|uniref:Uncharacterized protein n=1 Tax=Aspergillus phoenicis ATCC 13157 TaxID=1353007 RepID=A0A370PTS2_ASPPH|nr:hypothetical protein M752DRAFT_311431 [Aspergillus phoenicis ATCC 13157]
MSTLLTPLALVGWMGRAWDTDYTTPDTLPNSTGLGWVDGTGLGHRHPTRTVDQTPIRDWPRLGGWDGPGTTTRHTQHTQLTNIPGPTVGWMGRAWDIEHNKQHMSTPEFTSYLADSSQVRQHFWPHGWVDGTGLGHQHTTRQHNPDSSGSGLMVGWMGRAWKTIPYILTLIYGIDSHTGLASWLGGWDGPGRPYYIYLLGSNTGAYNINNKPGPGWVAGMGLGCTSSEPSPGLVGWLGQVESSDSTSITQPWLGGRDGPGTSDTGGWGAKSRLTAFISMVRNQALAGWQGRAWDVVVDFDNTALASLSIPASMTIVWLTLYRLHCSNKPSLGWVVGSGLGYRIQHPSNSSLQWWTRPRLGGWDGPGTSDTGEWGLWSYKVTSKLKRLTASIFALSKPWLGGFTAVVSQASVGWLGRAWDIGHEGGGLEAMDGLGLSDSTSTIQFTTAVDQASAGWLGRDWDTQTNLNSIASVGRLGRAWDMDSTPAIQPWLGGRDGPGTSDTGEGGLGCNQASDGRSGWAWGVGFNIHYIVHHCSKPGLGWAAGTGLGHRTRGVGVYWFRGQILP